MLAEQVSYTRSQIQTRPNQTGLSPFSVEVHSRVNALWVRGHWGVGVCLLQHTGNPTEERGLTCFPGEAEGQSLYLPLFWAGGRGHRGPGS